MKNNILTVIGGVVVFVAMFIGICFLAALPTYWLWNWLMPTLLGLRSITLVQAVGVNLLAGILFRGFKTS